jgi:hypothetical protein
MPLFLVFVNLYPPLLERDKDAIGIEYLFDDLVQRKVDAPLEEYLTMVCRSSARWGR